jgi:hypothetical protein
MKVLIILTITLILVGGYYYGIVINAEESNCIEKVLITEVGTDISDVIQYQNYIIVNNEVNTEKAGIYKIVYRHIDTNKEVIKEVHVINKDQKAYFIEKLVYEESTEEDKYVVSEVFNFQNRTNTIYNYYSTRTGFNNFMNGEISNNEFYNNTISLYTKGEIIDTGIYENECFMVGTDIDSFYGNKIVCIYTKNTNISKTIELDIEGNIIPTCIAGNDKYYYIAGYTNETNDFFKEKRKGNDSFVILLNRETNKIMDITMLPLNDDDEIIDIVYFDNYLYLMQENNGNSIRMVKLDIFGNLINESTIDLKYGFYNPKLKVIDGKIYFAYCKYDYDTRDYVNEINLLNKDLNIVGILNKYHNGRKIIDFYVKDDLIYILTEKHKNNCGYQYLIYDYSSNLLGKFESSSDDLILGLGLNNEIVALSQDKKQLKYYRVNSLIKMNDPTNIIYSNLTNEQNELNITNYKYLINGNIIKHDEKSQLEYNSNLFGNYLMKYYFDDVFEYYVHKVTKVMPFIGAIDQENYDLGLTISGNGTLYVNNMLIENNYVFNETGNYEIKLVGKDNLVETYNITISDLSVKFDDIKKEDYIDVDYIYQEYKENVNIEKTFIEKSDNQSNKKSSVFFYLVPAMTLGIVFLIIKKGV